MRIDFGSGEYVEISRSRKPMHIQIIVASRSAQNPLELIVNTAEVSQKDFADMSGDVIGPQILEQKVEGDEGEKSDDKSE